MVLDHPVKLWVFEEDVGGTQQLQVLLEKYFVWKQCFSWAILVAEGFSVLSFVGLFCSTRLESKYITGCACSTEGAVAPGREARTRAMRRKEMGYKKPLSHFPSE